jgi:hypothetical protein
MKILFLLTLIISAPAYSLEKVRGLCLNTVSDFLLPSPPSPKESCDYALGSQQRVQDVMDNGAMVQKDGRYIGLVFEDKVKQGDFVPNGTYEYLTTAKHPLIGSFPVFRIK